MAKQCQPPEERFWPKVAVAGPDDCWLWLAAKEIGGYGHFGGGQRGTPNLKAHRFSYALAHGPIPDELVVRHTCDVRACCNPRHLKTGTKQDNTDDKMSRGRYSNQPPRAIIPTLSTWERPKPRVECICEHCGMFFDVLPSVAAHGRGKYCSDPCYHEGRTRTAEDRFWEKVDKSGDCWIWTAARAPLPYDYGCFNFMRDGKWTAIRAHRFAWELAYGPIPDGLFVRHFVCDHPPCCRVEHLLLGTDPDNRADSVRKGRQAKGESLPQAKLTESAVMAIRVRVAAGERRAVLAMEFGVGHSVIDNVVNRQSWKHVP